MADRTYCQHGHKPACDLCVARREITRTRRKLSELRAEVRTLRRVLIDGPLTELTRLSIVEGLGWAADRSEVRRKKGGRS